MGSEPDPRPPGDRTTENDVLAEIRQLAERFERFVSQPPTVRVTNSWWDQLDNPFRNPILSGTSTPSLADLIVPNQYAEYRLPTSHPSSYLMLRYRSLPDGIELSLHYDDNIIWQRKLFYEGRK